MSRLFTKRFFALSSIDQAAVVDSELRDWRSRCHRQAHRYSETAGSFGGWSKQL